MMQPLDHRYQLLRRLGAGSFGEVWDAVAVGNRARVAVKVLLRCEDFERFYQEASILWNIRHPNIVALYEAGSLRQRPCYVMERVYGGTLAQATGGNAVDPRFAAEMVAILARAMHHVHEFGVVHRDLKPENILLAVMPTETQPKIVDFGIARLLHNAADLTQGTTLGTPLYLAPEQFGNLPGEIGPWTDVYGLGMILYNMLSGRLPFKRGNAMSMMRQVLHDEPVSPRRFNAAIPEAISQICLRCLQKRIADRYHNAWFLAQELDAFRSHGAILGMQFTQWIESLAARFAGTVAQGD